MILFINIVISSALEIVLLAIIPFVWWFITARKKEKFTKWIGLKKVEGGRNTFIAVILVSIAFLLSGALPFYLIKGVETAVSEFAGLGASAIPGDHNICHLQYCISGGALVQRLSVKKTGK